jgi:hypothetical protein
VESIGAITGGANQFPHTDDVHARLLLCVWVLDEGEDGVGLETRHLGQLDIVVDALAIKLEVEAGVLEQLGCLDDGLAEVLDLFLGGDLFWISSSVGMVGASTYGDLVLKGLVGQLDRYLEDGCRLVSERVCRWARSAALTVGVAIDRLFLGLLYLGVVAGRVLDGIGLADVCIGQSVSNALAQRIGVGSGVFAGWSGVGGWSPLVEASLPEDMMAGGEEFGVSN